MAANYRWYGSKGLCDRLTSGVTRLSENAVARGWGHRSRGECRPVSSGSVSDSSSAVPCEEPSAALQQKNRASDMYVQVSVCVHCPYIIYSYTLHNTSLSAGTNDLQ